MANRFKELLDAFPRGTWYQPSGTVLPYLDGDTELQLHQFGTATLTPNQIYGVYTNDSFRGTITADNLGRAIVRIHLDQGRQDIVLIDDTTGARFVAYVTVRGFATVLAAHADVFDKQDDLIQELGNSLSLARVTSRFVELFGRQVGQGNNLDWVHDSYRGLVRRLRQAFRLYGATLLGIRQAVHAYTSSLPLRIPKVWRPIWVLGQQLMGNGDLQQRARTTTAADDAFPSLNVRQFFFVHAAFGGAPTVFPGPFTDPPTPQLLTVTFSGLWNGGNVNITGTDENGDIVTDTFIPGAGSTVTGSVGFSFVTVTGATKGTGAVGTAAIGLATSHFIRRVSYGPYNTIGPHTLAYLPTPDRLRWDVGPTIDIGPTSPFLLNGKGQVTLHEPSRQVRFFGNAVDGGLGIWVSVAGSGAIALDRFLLLEVDDFGPVLIDTAFDEPGQELPSVAPSPAFTRTAAAVAALVNTHLSREPSYGAVRATATITVTTMAAGDNGKTLIFDDGVNPAVTFTYRVDGAGAPPPPIIDVFSFDTAPVIADKTAARVLAVGRALRISTGSTGLTPIVYCQNDFGGAQGNQPLTQTSPGPAVFVISGPNAMAGGLTAATFTTFAAAITGTPAFGTVLRLEGGTKFGPSSRLRIHPVGANAARRTLGEPRASSPTAGIVAREALTATLGSTDRFPLVDRIIIVIDGLLDTTAAVTAGFAAPTSPQALEMRFAASWRGAAVRVDGAGFPAVGALASERFVPDNQVSTGSRLVTLDGVFFLLGGAGDSLLFTAGPNTVVLTDAAGAFTTALIGTYIDVDGATFFFNNGTFLITAATPTTLTWINPFGTTEAVFPGIYGLHALNFVGVQANYFLRRTDNDTGAAVQYRERIAANGNVYGIRLFAAIAGFPFGPVDWELRKQTVVQGSEVFRAVTQITNEDPQVGGTTGTAKLAIRNAGDHGYLIRIGRSARISGFGGVTLVAAPGSGNTATFGDSTPIPVTPVFDQLDRWVLITDSSSENDGLHPIIHAPLPPGARATIRHQETDRGGFFTTEIMGGGVNWRVYSAGEAVRVVANNRTTNVLTFLCGPLDRSYASGELVEMEEGTPFAVAGIEGPGTITVDVDRDVLPAVPTSDTPTLDGIDLADGWRVLGVAGVVADPPGYTVPSRLQFNASGVATARLERALDIRGYRGLTLRAQFWVQQHVTSPFASPADFRVRFSFDGAAFIDGPLVAVPSSFLESVGNGGVLYPHEVAFAVRIPHNASSVVVQLSFVPAVATDKFSVEKCVVGVLTAASTWTGVNTVPLSRHKAAFGELLYVWSPEVLSATEVEGMGLPPINSGRTVPAQEGTIDRIVNAHGYWDRVDVSEYVGGVPASSAAPINVKGTYDELGWSIAQLTNMRFALGIPPRATVVRPARVSSSRYVSGFGDTIEGGQEQTLYDNTASFTQDLVGLAILIRDSNVFLNNGFFRILRVPDSISIVYKNVRIGAVDTGFTGSYRIDRAGEPITFIAPSNALLAEASAHEAPFPAPPFDGELLFGDATSIPSTSRSAILGSGGTGDASVTITQAGTTSTLEDLNAAFPLSVVGQTITLKGARPNNNRSFVVTARPTATQVTWTNPVGETEILTGSYRIEGPLPWRFLGGGISQTPGVTAAFAVAGTTVTITDPTANFSLGVVGKSVTVTLATTGTNNGTFVITARPGPTQISYLNAAGVAEAFAAGTTYAIPGTVLQVASAAAGDSVADRSYDDLASTPYFNAGAAHLTEYHRLLRAEPNAFDLGAKPNAFDLGANFADYIWFVDAAIYQRTEPEGTPIVKTEQLIVRSNFRARLSERSDGNKTTMSLIKDNGLTRTNLNENQWRLIDPVTVEIDQATFDPDAIYALTYTALAPKYPRQGNVIIEHRSTNTSIADVGLEPWRIVELDEQVNETHQYHQLRVTLTDVGDVRDIELTSLGVRGLHLYGTPPFAPGLVP